MKMHTKLLGSMALSALLITGFTGCGGEDTTTAAAPAASSDTVSPYERMAVISGTWADVPAIADKIAQYTTLVNEKTDLGWKADWVIAGANLAKSEIYETSDLLPIPGMGSAVTGTSRVVEFCNGYYAGLAMATGRQHGPALPCEVSVHSDGTNVYIDMLNADAIFSIFFTDISDDGTLKQVASDVKSELRTIVLAALDDSTVVAASNADLNTSIIATPAALETAVTYTESTEALGPKFSASDISDKIAFQSPYIVYKYSDGSAFTGIDAANLAQDIIDTLQDGSDDGSGGIKTAEDTPGLEGLSAGSLWRSGRPEPLPIPGIQVVEACSPKYAKKATALGNEYITALPCEVAVYVDETDDTNQTLAISFLNPNFMFGTMFEGAVSNAYINGDINQTQVVEYSTLAEVVFGDLRMIVDHAVQSTKGSDNFQRILTIKQ